MVMSAQQLREQVHQDLLTLTSSEISEIFKTELTVDWRAELLNPNSKRAKELIYLATEVYLRQLKQQLEAQYTHNIIKHFPETKKSISSNNIYGKHITIEDNNQNNDNFQLWQQIQNILQQLQQQYQELTKLHQTIATLTTEQDEIKLDLIALENQQKHLEQAEHIVPITKSIPNNEAIAASNASTPINLNNGEKSINITEDFSNDAATVENIVPSLDPSNTNDEAPTNDFESVNNVHSSIPIPQAKLIPMHNPFYQGKKNKPSDVNPYVGKPIYSSLGEIFEAISARQTREKTISELVTKCSKEAKQLQTSNTNLLEQLSNLTKGNFAPKFISFQELLNQTKPATVTFKF